MSAKNIITSLDHLLTLHKDLYEKAKGKTDIIKSGDVDELKKVTIDERKFIKGVHDEQKELMIAVQAFLQQHSIHTEQPRLQDCLQAASDEEREKLTTLQTELVETASSIKERNDLNQQLLQQSLQFVQLSLDLLSPDLEEYNYERPDRNGQYEQRGRSFFDSNA